MQLPSDLQRAITIVAEQWTERIMPHTARNVSDRYRDKNRHGNDVMVHTDADVAAYAATRMPGTYAALRVCMDHVAGVLPLWRPESMMDAGAGPGTGMWAASEVWPSIGKFRLLERVQGMIRIGRELAGHADRSVIREASWQETDLRSVWQAEPADLVTASYVINELGETEGLLLAEHLWEMTRGVLILVEPGTPAGWMRILKIRTHLISLGAEIAAPCPHSRPCPVEAPDWCHFTERVNRSKLHRRLKEADLAHEDEKFSYVALTRMAVQPCKARIRRHPMLHSGYLRLSLCTPDGLRDETVTRSQKESYRYARNAAIGDEWPSGMV